MEQGWISVHRKLQDSEIWNLEKFTRGQAWVDMILMANHKPGSFFLRGIEIKVDRGQIARSEESLAAKWRWSRGKVRRFFSWLEMKQQIVQHKSKLLSIVTIVNYNDYQKNSTTNSTTNGQQTDTNNNKNNVNKFKKEIYKEKKVVFGEFKNVKLTPVEHEKLIKKFGDLVVKEKIEALSLGIASKGYKYKSHYATILSWDRKNDRGKNAKGKPEGFADKEYIGTDLDSISWNN